MFHTSLLLYLTSQLLFEFDCSIDIVVALTSSAASTNGEVIVKANVKSMSKEMVKSMLKEMLKYMLNVKLKLASLKFMLNWFWL